MTTRHPEVSIIIRTYNEEKFLPTLLEGIRRQRHQDHEVIVVDSGSLDHTVDIAQSYDCRIERIHDRDFTFGYSLNTGISAARGAIAAIVSSHTEPVDEDWLGYLMGPFAQERTAMVYGRQRGGPRSKYSEVRDLHRTFGEAPLVLRPPRYFANNANSAIRRSLWSQKPFDEALPGLEDAAWAKHWMDQGYYVVYEPKAAIYHYHDETWKQVRNRYYREAIAQKRLGLRGRRHSLGTVFQEIGWAVSDVALSVVESDDRARVSSIARFRFEKARGMIRGYFDGASFADPEQRYDLFFDKGARALRVNAPHRMELVPVDIPQVRPGDVLVRVAFVGICHTDIEVIEGTLGYFRRGEASFPIVPGHECSGRVVAVGPNVKHVKPGDAVVVEPIQGCAVCAECAAGNAIRCAKRQEMGVLGKDGAYADFLVASGRFVHALPEGLSLQRAALAEPMAVVQKGIRRLLPLLSSTSPWTSVIVGGGSIGHLCALALRREGHDVTVIEPHEERRKLLESVGLKTSGDLNLAGADVIVEATGRMDVLRVVLAESPTGSHLLLLGLPYGSHEFSFEDIVAYDKIVVGSVGSAAQDFRRSLEMLNDLPIDAFLASVHPLERYETALSAVRARTHLKVMLHVDPREPPDHAVGTTKSAARIAATAAQEGP